MSAFSDAELDWLKRERRLARVATVGKDGTPHVVPTGWRFNSELDAIDMGGYNLERSKKFRDVRRSGRAALVIDEVLPPWRPAGIEVRGRAEAIESPTPLIRIFPERIVSWGITSDEMTRRYSRAVR
jgi:pyridoxamine 5'-phosphate oxidase family protein